MQRKVMISCAVTGSADTPGRNPAVPVTPAADRDFGDRRRQGGCRDRAHPCARPEDHAAEHGRRAVRRGGGPHPAERHRRGDQPDNRPGRALLPRPCRPDETRPRYHATHAAPARAARARPASGNLLARHGQHEHGRECVREHAADPRGHGDRHPRRRRDARARGIRDRAPAARQAHDRDRAHQGARHVPDLPRHRLGPARDARRR